MGNFLAVQSLGFWIFTTKSLGSIPGWGTKNLKRGNDDLGDVMVNCVCVCVCVCEMVNFMCQFDRLRDTQRADKILLLGVSMRVFLEEVNIWTSGLGKVVALTSVNGLQPIHWEPE